MSRSAVPLLTYEACCDRFRAAAADAGLAVTSHPIDAPGPVGEDLEIDVAVHGSATPTRTLLVMSGVHGVEGAAGSVLQSDLLGRLPRLGDDDAIVFVHAVNPWGMAWWRRQNEHNVDLNRNWGAAPGRLGNTAYPELHDLLCPAAATLPDGDSFVADLGRMSAERGPAWLRRAISSGQDTHPDGLYFAGHTEQPSTTILRSVAERHLAGSDELVVVDLHTGHGAWGTATILTRVEHGSDDERWIRTTFDGIDVEVSGDGTDGQVVAKGGQLRVGIEEVVGAAISRSVTLELGTRSEITMIVAERAEHWVHRHGTPDDPDHEAVRTHHFHCSAPDDAAWWRNARMLGGRALDRAIAATFGEPAGP